MTPQQARDEAHDLNERAKESFGQERDYLKGRAKDLWAYADQEAKRMAGADRIRRENNEMHGKPRARKLTAAKEKIKTLDAELKAAKEYIAENCPEHIEGFALAINAASEDAAKE